MEKRELTGLAKCLHSTVVRTLKSKEMFKEMFFMRWYGITTQYWLISFDIGITIRKEIKYWNNSH